MRRAGGGGALTSRACSCCGVEVASAWGSSGSGLRDEVEQAHKGFSTGSARLGQTSSEGGRPCGERGAEQQLRGLVAGRCWFVVLTRAARHWRLRNRRPPTLPLTRAHSPERRVAGALQHAPPHGRPLPARQRRARLPARHLGVQRGVARAPPVPARKRMPTRHDDGRTVGDVAHGTAARSRVTLALAWARAYCCMTRGGGPVPSMQDALGEDAGGLRRAAAQLRRWHIRTGHRRTGRAGGPRKVAGASPGDADGRHLGPERPSHLAALLPWLRCRRLHPRRRRPLLASPPGVHLAPPGLPAHVKPRAAVQVAHAGAGQALHEGLLHQRRLALGPLRARHLQWLCRRGVSVVPRG